MAWKVKCQVTKEVGTSDVFYKADNGKYYKNKDIYDEFIHNKEMRDKIKDTILDILNYPSTCKFPSLMAKKIEEYKSYGYDVIYETLIYKRDVIEYCILTKKFNSELAKINYIFGIINNSINDVFLKHKRIENIRKNEDQKDIPIDNDNTFDLEISNNTKKTKDITDLLEENGWM